MKKLEISCTGADTLELAAIEPFQGDLKELSPEAASKLQRSLEEYGFSFPFFVWRNGDTYKTLDGHQRLDVINRMDRMGWDIPPLPVVWIDAESEQEAKKKVLLASSAFGRANEESLAEFMLNADIEFDFIADLTDLQEIDLGQLEDLVVDFDGDGLGGSGEEIDEDLIEESEVDKVHAKWGAEVGQIWTIDGAAGSHRLCVGDSADEKVVAKLMDGKRAKMFATDPPYGVAFTDEHIVAADKGSGNADRKMKWETGIKNDEMDDSTFRSFLSAIFATAINNALDEYAAWYIWHSSSRQDIFRESLEENKILVNRQIIWSKPHFVFGPTHYHMQHEPCFYGWQKGNMPDFNGKRNQTTIWEITNETSAGQRLHPTQKPVEVFAKPMRNHTKKGDIVFEPFSGSGTQFVAAEQESRVCYGMELDPRFASVILERLERIGLNPKLEN